MKDIKIFQTFHKDFIHNSECKWIQPIGVNGYDGGSKFLQDAAGDNISHLNPYYCELTTIYWVWKNYKSKYIGFYHYRRYLHYILNSTWNSFPQTVVLSLDEQHWGIDYLTSSKQLESLREILAFYDVVIPWGQSMLPSVEHQYLSCVEPQPWMLFREKIDSAASQEKKASEIFSLFKRAPICNMFVMRWDIFDAYCHDLFETINSVYQAIGNPYDKHNNRYPGFLAERYLVYWLYRQKIQAFEVPFVLILQ